MPTYAVTGASGPFGRLAVGSLLARGVAPADVVAVVRTPAKAADLAARGVEVRRGDYSEPESLPAALDGVERLLLVSASEVGHRLEQHTNVLTAARAAGVRRVVYTSLVHADTSPLPLAAEHVATEAALRDSGIPATVLRNNWYTENYTGRLAQFLATGEILSATGGAHLGAAARADYAGAAAAVLTGEGHEGAVYELSGTGFTLDALAEAVTRVTGTPVTHRTVDSAGLVAALTAAGLDEGTAGFVAALDAGIAAGALDDRSADLEKLLGRPLTPLDDVVRAAA
ncbi:SDR family oxidoreductase [Kineococcus sp. NUM-3379]